MTDAFSFSKLIPSFDFLQGLTQAAGAAIPGLPGIGQWVAPTLNREELEKRIGELRTVQFWLEQNARLLGATIQALEVQRMTLSTLKTMNVQMGDLRDSLTAAVPVFSTAASPPVVDEKAADSLPDKAAAEPTPTPTPTPTPPSGVDPMQWWSALTQQFSELANKAMTDNAAEAAKRMVGGVAKSDIFATSARPAPRKSAPLKTATLKKATAKKAPAKKAPAKAGARKR